VGIKKKSKLNAISIILFINDSQEPGNNRETRIEYQIKDK
jgi:hypothetical protein